MSGSGAPRVDVGEVSGLRVVVIASSWHDGVMSGLVAGALRACADAGVEPELVRVPGAFELPVTAQAAARSGAQAVVCLGVVIRGGTPHFDYVCQAVSQGTMDLNIKHGKPVIFCVLTDNTMEQARDRSGGKHGNKGVECAVALLRMCELVKRSVGHRLPAGE